MRASGPFGSRGTVGGGLKCVKRRGEWGTHAVLGCELEVGDGRLGRGGRKGKEGTHAATT